MVKVRNIIPNDYILFQQLVRKCSPLDIHTSYTYWLMAKYYNKSSFILEVNNKPCGYIMTIENSDVVFIWQIAIIESQRKKGYSELLIDKVVEYAKNIRKPIEITIDKNNINSTSAFKGYCSKNNYSMISLEEQEIYNENNIIHEKEILYHIDVF